MAQETELERLVVRLVGDGSSYMKMLKEAQAGNEKAKTGFEGLAASAAAALGAFGAIEFLKTAKSEWQAAETAAFKLSAVLKTQGRDVANLSADYAEFATRQQSLTTFSDEEVMGLLKIAESFDLTGAAAKGAARDAMALAAATDISAESAMRIVQAIEKGDVERAKQFSRPVMQLRGIQDTDDYSKKYADLIRAGNQLLEDELKTGAGKAKHFENQWSDTLEGIGKAYSEVANPVKMAKQTFMEFWAAQDEGTRDAGVHIAGWAANVTIALTSVAAFNTLLPTFGANLKAAATNPFLWATVAAAAVAALVGELKGLGGETDRLEKDLAKLDKVFARNAKFWTGQAADRLSGAGGDKEAIEAEVSRLDDLIKGRKEALGQANANRENRWVRGAVQLGGMFGIRAPEFEEQEAAFRGMASELKALENAQERATAALREAAEAGRNKNSVMIIGVNIAQNVSQGLLKQKEATDAATRSLEEQNEAMRLGASRAGDTAEEVARAKQIGEDRAKLFQMVRAGSTAEQIHKERIAQDENRALKEREAAIQSINSLIEGAKSPEQRMADRMKILNDALLKGRMLWSDYERAVRHARDELLGAAAAGRDAASSLSVEAGSRIDAHLESLRRSGDPVADPRPFERATFPNVPRAPRMQDWAPGRPEPMREFKPLIDKLDEVKKAIQQIPGVPMMPSGLTVGG